MKTTICILLALCILSACSKEEQKLRDQFSGKWEYIQYSGYPFTNTTLPPGNGRIIVLFRDGSFERRQHDTVVFRGRYTIVKKDDCLSRDNTSYFSNNDTSFSNSGYVSLEGDKLGVSSSNCLQDGGTVYYRKLE